MKKRSGSKTTEHRRLIALGYRSHPDKIAVCVNRLRMGEKPWQLYGATAGDPIVSQDLGMKVAKDYAEGKLDFLEPFHVDENKKAEKDPFRITRYDIVKEAEEMAPHRLWNFKHMSCALGLDHGPAVELLEEYDALRAVRDEAEVVLTSFQHVDHGRKVTIEIPSSKAMKHFRSLPRYLSILYEMYYRTEYPDAPKKWVRRACNVRVDGQLPPNEDERLVVAADNIFRYAVWRGEENLDSYFKSLSSLGKTKASGEKLIKELKRRFKEDE